MQFRVLPFEQWLKYWQWKFCICVVWLKGVCTQLRSWEKLEERSSSATEIEVLFHSLFHSTMINTITFTFLEQLLTTWVVTKLPNLESCKALLSNVKGMVITAGVVVSSLNAQYIIFLPLLFRVDKKKTWLKTVGGLVTVNSVCADCSSLLHVFYTCINTHI